ncbi:MAG: hypothetical protein HW407_1495 [Bacteroidetes bacterium]|nr:hypothetical protein [Bacteroidota bacterium]
MVRYRSFLGISPTNATAAEPRRAVACVVQGVFVRLWPILAPLWWRLLKEGGWHGSRCAVMPSRRVHTFVDNLFLLC